MPHGTPRAEVDRPFRAFMTVLHLAMVAAVLYLAWRARSYYLAPLDQRPFHEGYVIWRPAGEVGHAVGFLGTIALLALLLYSVRKRTRLFGRAGRMSRWLSAHIFLGVWGPILVTVHTSFKVQGLVAVSYWSMVAVALSGVLGRFLYRQIPRTIAGQELDSGQLDRRERELVDAIGAELDETAAAALLAEVRQLALPPRGKAVRQLAWLLRRNLSLRAEVRGLLASHGVASEQADRLVATVGEQILLRRRRAVGHQVQQAFHYWHVIHKPFAVIMLVIMVVHVGVAFWLGYRWIF